MEDVVDLNCEEQCGQRGTAFMGGGQATCYLGGASAGMKKFPQQKREGCYNCPTGVWKFLELTRTGVRRCRHFLISQRLLFMFETFLVIFGLGSRSPCSRFQALVRALHAETGWRGRRPQARGLHHRRVSISRSLNGV